MVTMQVQTVVVGQMLDIYYTNTSPWRSIVQYSIDLISDQLQAPVRLSLGIFKNCKYYSNSNMSDNE
jgi:hypothetical protein